MEIYIFGAGASAAEGAPATGDFFPTAFRSLGPHFDERVEAVWTFLQAVFGRPIEGPDSFAAIPPVDEVISLIDGCLHANQGLGPRYDLPRLYQVRRDLEHLLCRALDRRLSPGGPHARFAADLAARFRPGSVAVLSLNYDTLLDTALAQAGLQPWYGLDDRAPDVPALFLGKLHGSLNWAQCPACGQIDLIPPGTAGNCPAVEAMACSHCGSRLLHSLIISPTWLKSYQASRLQRVWDRAHTMLEQSSRICFVGYSMPPADVPVYQLILRALLTGGRKAQVAIEVINHHPANITEAEERQHAAAVTARFRRLFGSRIHVDFSGFRGQA